MLFLCLLLFVPMFASMVSADQAANKPIPEVLTGRTSDASMSGFGSNISKEALTLMCLPGYFMPNVEPTSSVFSGLQGKSIQTFMLTSNPSPIQVYVVCDAEMKTRMEINLKHPVTWDDVYMWAWNILEGGDDPFWSYYGIDFNMFRYSNWISPAQPFNQLLYTVQSAKPKPADCDIEVLMTGRNDGPILGMCEGWPTQPGQKFPNTFLMTVNTWFVMPPYPSANNWQHEASHLFHAPDHNPGLFDFDIMSYFWSWTYRNWCGTCVTAMTPNLHRFD